MNGKQNSYVAIVDDDESVCRSGGRSAIACNLLAQAGFTKGAPGVGRGKSGAADDATQTRKHP